MKGRPKAIIGIYVINEEGNKLLLGLNKIESNWKIPGGLLLLGEDFPDCALRELLSKLNLKVKPDRLQKFVSFNVLDKEKSYHNIEIDFILQITRMEEVSIRNCSKTDYDWWVWFDYNEVLDVKNELSCGIEVFFKKYEIRSVSQIQKIFAKYTLSYL